MRRRRFSLARALGALAFLGAVAIPPSLAVAGTSGGAGSTDPTSPSTCAQDSGGMGFGQTCGTSGKGYVNPFKGGDWDMSRIDMGVDYIPNEKSPVLAIGDAKVLTSSMRSGWPGGAFITYKLLDGDHEGDVIFVAEHLTRLAPEGTKVAAGQPIATALPGSPWLEIGWATSDSQPRAYPCYSEGMATNSGKEMARFLDNLGAKAPKVEAGPDFPSGKRC